VKRLFIQKIDTTEFA